MFLTKTENNTKLTSLLDQNLKKLDGYDKFSLELDFQDCRKLLTKTFSGCLSIWEIRSLFPTASLSNCYGYPKLYKEGEPLRGLATAYDALVNNNGSFLKNC